MEPKILDITAKQKTGYCVPLWVRDEQIKLAIERNIPRIQPSYALRPDPIALVCYGPTLAETWEQIRDFKYVMTCSGSHKFLVQRGITPTHHVDVDPRAHKVGLMGLPCDETEYYIASTCHPDLFDHLNGHKVFLWHVFDCQEDALRTLPPGEWAIMGGCSVGLRTMTLARFLGFTDLHIFGMDGCQKDGIGKHAGYHPKEPPDHSLTEYPVGSGKMWKVTPSILEAARGTMHEINQMPDTRFTFYGDGLVQTMVEHEPRTKHPDGTKFDIAYCKPALISASYRDLNRQLHRDNIAYGVGGGKHAQTILKIAKKINSQSILDYGCGKGYLAKHIPFPIWEYDPAIPGKEEPPRPADLVVCTDVLEHIEPENLGAVLKDLHRCTRMVGYFTIHTGASKKQLADGRNTHLIQQPRAWWEEQLSTLFQVARVVEQGPELLVVVAPKRMKKKKAA